MTIRRAAEGDRASIEALVALFPDKLVQETLPETGAFFVAEEDGAIIGCCALEVYSKKIAEIRSLAVRPEWQGKGVASALVEVCLARADSEEVREILAITGAVEFFDKLGFRSFHQEKYALFRMRQ